MKNFQDLIVWQKAHALLLEVYKITRKFPHHELFTLTSQIRRASLSVGSNIVEGFKRAHIKESIQFYAVAAASLEEVKYQLIVARDLGYIDAKEYNQIEFLADEVGRVLHGWIRSQS